MPSGQELEKHHMLLGPIRLGITLPHAYKEFLLAEGQQTGLLMTRLPGALFKKQLALTLWLPRTFSIASNQNKI